ncbi:hypothetical protein EUGRSUZ_B02528 [Eucalyptus grandis]|uniref:Uncharacterized protein n=2 Tax=Eucalyptus grandis TaxID=71139 RepID=A0ACC3LTM9_EUCGR|nr:hypothetical protein EUGRSUZ_B02528 [Eucalyptus grandis]
MAPQSKGDFFRRRREEKSSFAGAVATMIRSGTAPSSVRSFVRSFVRSRFIPSPPLFSYKGKGIHPWEEHHFPPAAAAAAAAAWWRATEFNETPPPRIAALDLFLLFFFFFFFFGNLMSALMCKTKMAVEATEPARRPPSSSPRRPPTSSPRLSASQTPRFAPASSDPSPSASSSGGDYTSTSFPKHSSGTGTSTGTGSSSLSGFRHSLPDNPVIYDFSELRSATNNFLAKPRHSSSSSSCWRCSLRGKDVIVFRRKFRRKIEMGSLKELLGMICRSHLVSIAKLLGASVSGDNIFLAYEFVDGASLSDCLRNPKIPNFTVLRTWMSRMQVAADVAHGLDYIHNNTGLNMILGQDLPLRHRPAVRRGGRERRAPGAPGAGGGGGGGGGGAGRRRGRLRRDHGGGGRGGAIGFAAAEAFGQPENAVRGGPRLHVAGVPGHRRRDPEVRRLLLRGRALGITIR